MTGKFIIIKKKKRYKTSFYYLLKKNDTKHDHITLIFNNKTELIYNDVRKFGFIKIFPTTDVMKCSHLLLLGPEPLSNHFNVSYFQKYIHNKKIRIKDLLMNQKFVAGLGNIYCNEILFMCKINPNKSVEKINQEEIRNIIKFMKKILKEAISLGGSSIKNFSSTTGEKGNFQQKFNVYGREKNNCLLGSPPTLHPALLPALHPRRAQADVPHELQVVGRAAATQRLSVHRRTQRLFPPSDRISRENSREKMEESVR